MPKSPNLCTWNIFSNAHICTHVFVTVNSKSKVDLFRTHRSIDLSFSQFWNFLFSFCSLLNRLARKIISEDFKTWLQVSMQRKMTSLLPNQVHLRHLFNIHVMNATNIVFVETFLDSTFVNFRVLSRWDVGFRLEWSISRCNNGTHEFSEQFQDAHQLFVPIRAIPCNIEVTALQELVDMCLFKGLGEPNCMKRQIFVFQNKSENFQSTCCQTYFAGCRGERRERKEDWWNVWKKTSTTESATGERGRKRTRTSGEVKLQIVSSCFKSGWKFFSLNWLEIETWTLTLFATLQRPPTNVCPTCVVEPPWNSDQMCHPCQQRCKYEFEMTSQKHIRKFSCDSRLSFCNSFFWNPGSSFISHISKGAFAPPHFWKSHGCRSQRRGSSKFIKPLSCEEVKKIINAASTPELWPTLSPKRRVVDVELPFTIGSQGTNSFHKNAWTWSDMKQVHFSWWTIFFCWILNLNLNSNLWKFAAQCSENVSNVDFQARRRWGWSLRERVIFSWQPTLWSRSGTCKLAHFLMQFETNLSKFSNFFFRKLLHRLFLLSRRPPPPWSHLRLKMHKFGFRFSRVLCEFEQI